MSETEGELAGRWWWRAGSDERGRLSAAIL